MKFHNKSHGVSHALDCFQMQQHEIKEGGYKFQSRLVVYVTIAARVSVLITIYRKYMLKENKKNEEILTCVKVNPNYGRQFLATAFGQIDS